MRECSLLLTIVLLGGCGGEFILTAPDGVGLPGQTVPLVVRLQRREFWVYAPPMPDAAITFRLGDGPLRCARTDKAGYAAVGLTLPAEPGRHRVSLRHQDAKGDTVSGSAAVYVLETAKPIAAVDLDSLPSGGRAAAEAAAALKRIAAEAQLVYVTQHYASSPAGADEMLRKAGYPGSAALCYLKDRPWYSMPPWRRANRPNLLAVLRQRLPGLRWGIAADDDSAEAFRDAGLIVLGVRDGSAREASTQFFRHWAELRLPPAGPGK